MDSDGSVPRQTSTNTQTQTQLQTHNHKHKHNHEPTSTSATTQLQTQAQHTTKKDTSTAHYHSTTPAHNHNHSTQPQHTTTTHNPRTHKQIREPQNSRPWQHAPHHGMKRNDWHVMMGITRSKVFLWFIYLIKSQNYFMNMFPSYVICKRNKIYIYI